MIKSKQRPDMLIAKSKRKSNIVEYLLYMYQIEDIIRSFRLDINAINISIIQKYDQGESIKKEIEDWYRTLIKEMKEEKIEVKGHLSQLTNIVEELVVLHNKLLTTIQDKKYMTLYEDAKPMLKQLLLKSEGEGLKNEIDVALHGLYGLLLLRLKGEEITELTEKGMQKISSFLAHLAYWYHQLETDTIQIRAEQNN